METNEGVNRDLQSRDGLRQDYLGKGFCLSPPLLTKNELGRANGAVSRVLDGRYATGIAPPYRNLEPGTPIESESVLPYISAPNVRAFVWSRTTTSILSISTTKSLAQKFGHRESLDEWE